MPNRQRRQAIELTHEKHSKWHSLPHLKTHPKESVFYLQCWMALEVMMRLTMKARQEVTKATARQYRGASKKEKVKILDQSIVTPGYIRCYARLVLRHEGRRLQTDKQTIVVVERKSSTKRKSALL